MDCQVSAKTSSHFHRCFQKLSSCLIFGRLTENDIVNVSPKPGIVADVKRARILRVRQNGFDVMYHDFEKELVDIERIHQPVKLPWRPEDLRENFIVLRRRLGRSENYIEKDLRVRWRLLNIILFFLTQRGEWRPGHGEETMHMWYDAFDMRDDHEMETIFPQDAVPPQLNFQDLTEDDLVTELRFATFQDWLMEGKFQCEGAQALLHLWMHDLRGQDSDTLRDLFDQLFQKVRGNYFW